MQIGFLPSNILANYALKNFDKAILDGWNPIYFGRYVDDVIVVDKSAFISFHLKTYYALTEKQEINGYRLGEVKGNHYDRYYLFRERK